MRLYRCAAALLAATVFLPLTGCIGGAAAFDRRTHAGMQTPSQDFSASAGNSMSGQMDNSIKGDYEADTPPAEDPPAESRPAAVMQPQAALAAPQTDDAQPTAAAQAADGPQVSSGSPSAESAAPPAAGAQVSDSPSSGEGGAPSAAGAQTVDPQDFLLLVNDASRLPQGYVPPLAAVPGSEKQLHPAAAQALTRMMAAAAAENCPLHLVSGYRSVSYQQGLFERKVQTYLERGLTTAEAETEAAKWVARPGASEHALGLAADIVSGDWYTTHSDLTADFADTAAFAWLQRNAAAYGFVLRYPADKESVTGVHYEPWHWRYVGDAAPAIAASGLCLEEWLAAAADSASHTP